MNNSKRKTTAAAAAAPHAKKSNTPRTKTIVWVVIEGEQCDDTGSDPMANYPENADMTVVGVCSSLRGAQQLAIFLE